MNIRDTIESIRVTPSCRVLPPSGMPVADGAIIPEDLRVFYGACGGVELYSGSDYPINIVCPSSFLRSNQVILNEAIPDDISHYWFVVAENGDDRISIDCNAARLGKCYDSYWDRHAMRGSSAVVAMSFSELLERLFNNKGGHWYWLLPGFSTYGDAYDGMASV